MSLFNVNKSNLIRLLLPLSLREPKTRGWLGALTEPVWYLYDAFKKNRSDNLYYLTHNSQVVYMQVVLNDRFDNTLRRISIVDGDDTAPIYVHTREELKPIYVHTRVEDDPLYLYTRGETNVGFIVLVPAAVIFDMVEIKALVDRYKLPGITYKIVVV